MFRSIAFAVSVLISSATFTAPGRSSEVSEQDDVRIVELQKLFLNREPCTHECRTDHCTNEDRHDIVGSVNRTHYAEDIETCSDHIGATCEDHDCSLEFAFGQPSLYEVVEELRRLPVHTLLRATELIPELQLNSAASMVQVVGCGGAVVANILLDAASTHE